MTEESAPLWVAPPPGQDRIRLLTKQLDDWTRSSDLSHLVTLFGATPPANLALGDRLRWLESFSATWDFRRKARESSAVDARDQDAAGGARWEITPTGLDQEAEARILDHADRLGLVTSRKPLRRDAEAVIVLGGARMSNLYRPQYARRLIDDELVRPQLIFLLGGARRISRTERDAIDRYAPEAETEFEALVAGGCRQLGLDLTAAKIEGETSADHPNAAWRVIRFERASTSVGATVVGLEAPSREPDARRATTSDAYQFLADRFGLPAGTSVLLVTSQIYVPYQHLEAVRTLAIPQQLGLETVGFPVEWLTGEQSLQRAPNYLQEIRSAILAANRLYASYLAAPTSSRTP